MDKVIINGVDVSECDRLRTYRDWTYSSDKWCGISNDGGCECKQNPDCYYKQLQRAETEIEELKKQVKNNETAYHTELGTYNMECGNLLEENKTLIAENEKLKIDIGIYKGIIDSDKEENERLKEESEQLKKQYNCYACDSCGGKEDYINMKRHTENAIKTVHKYRQALQEIRGYILSLNYESKELRTIQDKINEVIGAEE